MEIWLKTESIFCQCWGLHRDGVGSSVILR